MMTTMHPAHTTRTPYRELGARIRKRRQALGWKQADLAEHVGVHVNSVQKWEKGEQYPERHAGRLEEVLGIPIDGETAAAPQRTLLDEVFGDQDARLIRRATEREYPPEKARQFLARIEDKLRRLGYDEDDGTREGLADCRRLSRPTSSAARAVHGGNGARRPATRRLLRPRSLRELAQQQTASPRVIPHPT